EWYYDADRKVVQMVSPGPPGGVRASAVETILNLSNLSHYAVDGIVIEGAGTAAIDLSYGGDYRIQNSDVSLSGTDAIIGNTVSDLTIENVSITNTAND